MAFLKNSKTIFAFTSPRTIEKIIPEISILVSEYKEKKWDINTQKSFFEKLFASDFYEGREKPKDTAFAARDRITRAPKALGFVDLKPVIRLTEVGEELVSGRRIHEVIAKQLLKFQLPSPYHKVNKGSDYNVRPYLELLRLVKKFGNVSKIEIAIFFLQMTNHLKFDDVVREIEEYRLSYSNYSGNKKIFTDNVFSKKIIEIYKEDIKSKKFRGRQDKDTTVGDFVIRKKANHIDYADALVRYLRATELVTFNKNFRIIISPSRISEVDYILENIERNALVFKNEEEFKDYLFSSKSLCLLNDNRDIVEKKLTLSNIKFDKSMTILQLKNLIEDAEVIKMKNLISETERNLKGYKEFDDIIDVFIKLNTKVIPDPSLYLEWNVWRAMVMINYTKHIQGNFKLDLDGIPLNTAGGGMPDIEIEYDSFKLIIEVTMSSGQKQYEMEGEPVPRHYGKIKNSSEKEVYCLFIAPKISEGALAHFFSLNKTAPRFYGGQTNIIPMSLPSFIHFITAAKDCNFNNPDSLQKYLDRLLKSNRESGDEYQWLSLIDSSSVNWF